MKMYFVQYSKYSQCILYTVNTLTVLENNIAHFLLDDKEFYVIT